MFDPDPRVQAFAISDTQNCYVIDDALRELIVARAPVRQIKDAARRNGTRFLRDAAVDLFLDGLTTLEEVNRVTLVS